MTGGSGQLERQVAEQMSLLRRLPNVPPSAACVARVHAAVRAEAARSLVAIRIWRAARSGLGVAAALLLMLGWGLMHGESRGSASVATDTEILNDWVNAADASGRAVTMLVDPNWPIAEGGGIDAEAMDAAAELDDLLRSFDDLQEIGA